jgi:predicted ATPase
MPLEKLEAHNFKSFRDLSVELGQLTVLIGANASGKSNFVQLLQFLHNIADYGLDNAVSIQGGNEYLTNLQLLDRELLKCSFQLGSGPGIAGFAAYVSEAPANRSDYLDLSPLRFSCDFGLTRSNRKAQWRVAYDRVTVTRDVLQRNPDGRSSHLGIAEVRIDAEQLEHQIISVPAGVSVEQIFSAFWLADFGFLRHIGKPSGALLLEHFISRSSWPGLSSATFLSQLAVYDFQAKLPKETAQVSGKIDLAEDGSNLVIVLKRILEDEEQRRTFSNLLAYVLPFAAEVDVQRLADRFLHFRLRETYQGDTFLPASLLSDGTINVIALIVALFFNDKPLIVIEEPERNIHPYLIARVAELLKDASRNKQIIVTTHSPELVKNVALDDLLFVSRNREGFSTIKRPAEMSDVQVFLENEVGIADLFTHDLLGA